MILVPEAASYVCCSRDREKWLAMRRSGVGASEVAAVLGRSPWSSAVAIFADKVDPEAPAESQNEAMAWGQHLEPVILGQYNSQTGREARSYGHLLRSKRWPFLLATLDGMTEVEGEPAALEIKTTMVREGWRDGIPEHVWIQCQAQMAVTGFKLASVAVLIQGCEFKYADVSRDQDFIEAMVGDCEKFWKLVESGGPPPQTDGSEATRVALNRLYPRDEGGSIALDGSFTNLVDELEQIKARQASDDARRGEIENAIRAAIGSATYGVLQNGGRFSYKANKKGARTLRYNAPLEG